MRRDHSARLTALLLAAGVATLSSGAEAPAGPIRQRAVQNLTPASRVEGACFKDGAFLHGEVESHLAVSPIDPKHMVAAWQQDRRATGARAIGIAVTTDGGITWRRSLAPGISGCTGSDRWTWVSDPWLAIDSAGKVYLAVLSGSEDGNALLVLTSEDRGTTWSEPVPVVAYPTDCVGTSCTGVPLGTSPDKEMIVADAKEPGHAYVVWTHYTRAGGVAAFSSTSDGGETWSAPEVIQPPENQANHLASLPDGTLIHVFWPNYDFASGRSVDVFSARSTDGGKTWSDRQKLGVTRYVQPRGAVDPRTRKPLRTAYFPSIATARDGTTYVAWATNPRVDSSRVVFVRTSDAGRTWTRPRAVARIPAQSFGTAIAVDRRGAVAVVYDDFLADRGGDDQLSTTIRIAHSHDRGSSWRIRKLFGPFDAMTAPAPGGFPMIGDYQGLVGLDRGFAAALQVLYPYAKRGGSDIFFTRLHVVR